MENQNPDFEAKFQRFSNIISTKTLLGLTVADRNDKTLVAVLVKPSGKVNNVLHVIISFISCGLWLPVWGILAMANPKEQRFRISIDSGGNLLEEKIKI